MNKSIILTGIMGSGKTSVGKELASLKNYPFFDLDYIIENKTGLKIAEIFKQFGEKYFRELETQEIKLLSKTERIILSLGGGAFCNQENIDILKKSGKTIYLKTSTSEILDRLSEEEINKRPLLKNIDNLNTLLQSREYYYNQADLIILTDGKNVKDIATEILEKISLS